ncbi:hypothetical protein CK203_117515 [Vitis vinifera]|uniref:Uncharacterized protein n=1 Tax=Vitis vinifera TaxID=29760 RepID=A0A438DWE2_VITVI|nr:hypothetical protein CK203_117515 [Vitis vinifera]
MTSQMMMLISITFNSQVVDVSKLPLLDMLEILNQHTYLTERVMKDKYKKTLKLLVIGFLLNSYMVHQVVSGDAKANRLLQLINNLKIDPKPPIAILSLGSQTNFSLSLGWVR